MIEGEDDRRVSSLKTQREVDRHIRNMRIAEEKTLVDSYLPAWRSARSVPWFAARHRHAVRVRSESDLLRLFYLEACDRIRDALNRHAWIEKARDHDQTTTREVEALCTA